MTLSLDQIKEPIEGELLEFEKMFKESMKSSVPLLDTIMNYIVKRKGKQIRPIFVMMSAGLFGSINERTHRGACLVELLHTATLVHDDVVDESSLRRGFFSINALWKNKIAVLVGDYLLSQGLILSTENADFDLLRILSNAVKDMSEGELLQLEKSRYMGATEDIYYEIIRKKTASLIASCCSIGARSTQNSEEITEKMRRFGELIGLSFQIRDDLFDFGDNKSGKPAGIDIKEKKLTLPLIYALQQADKSQGKSIKGVIKSKIPHAEKMQKVILFINEYKGIEYAQKKMHEFKNQAFEILQEIAQESIYKTNMKHLVNFVIERSS